MVENSNAVGVLGKLTFEPSDDDEPIGEDTVGMSDNDSSIILDQSDMIPEEGGNDNKVYA